jgi:hypothetical protein
MFKESVFFLIDKYVSGKEREMKVLHNFYDAIVEMLFFDVNGIR